MYLDLTLFPPSRYLIFCIQRGFVCQKFGSVEVKPKMRLNTETNVL